MKQRVILLIGMYLCFAGMKAQNEAVIAQANADSLKMLNKELANRDKIIDRLNNEIKELETNNAELDSALNAERREGKAAKYKQQIKQLKQDSIDLSNQLANFIEETQIKSKVSNDAMNEQRRKDSLTIVSLQDQLNELKSFRTVWLAQLAESVDEKWLNKPYSAIDVQKLETDFQQYDEFASSDEKVATARDKLKVLVSHVQLYQEAVAAVNSIYNADVVNSLIVPIRTLRDDTTEVNTKEELTLLYQQLNDYSITIEIFQEVIGEVNKVITGEYGHNAAWPLAKAILDKQESDSEYITAIQKIPWLSQQYKEYFNTLKEDCTKPNPVAVTIMEIRP